MSGAKGGVGVRSAMEHAARVDNVEAPGLALKLSEPLLRVEAPDSSDRTDVAPLSAEAQGIRPAPSMPPWYACHQSDGQGARPAPRRAKTLRQPVAARPADAAPRGYAAAGASGS